MSDRFSPEVDTVAEYDVCFSFGDFRKAKFGFQTGIEIKGNNFAWFAEEAVKDFLLAVARRTGRLVQVNDRSKEPEGIRKGTAWRIMRIETNRWVVRAGDQAFDSANMDLSDAAPGPPDDDPPPPDSQAGPDVTAQEKEQAVQNGYAPNGSAPPRLARSMSENIALMDSALSAAVALCQKHKPNVAHVDQIAVELFTAFAISGVRIDEDKANQVVAGLKKG